MLIAVALGLSFFAAQQLAAQNQDPNQDTTRKELRGVVARVVIDTAIPMRNATVVLHRFDSLSGGRPLDSTLTNARGEFRIDVRPTGGEGVVYFVSSSYSGIAYFSEMWHAHDLDSAVVDLTVFDTTSAPVPVTVAGRHLVVFAPVAGGRRRVVEVYDLANDSSVTRIARGDSVPVWRARVPRGARDFGPGPGMPATGALTLADDEVHLFTPFAPGLRQVTFAYTLPDGAFPLVLTMESRTDVMEVLLAEQGAVAIAPGMEEQGLVNIEGQGFRRYVATDVPAGTELRLDVPAGPPFMLILLVVGTAMLVALAFSFRRRAPLATSLPSAAPFDMPPGLRTRATIAANTGAAAEADALARRIAELDRTHAARATPDAKERDAYKAERERLKKQLAALLARRGGPP